MPVTLVTTLSRQPNDAFSGASFVTGSMVPFAGTSHLWMYRMFCSEFHAWHRCHGKEAAFLSWQTIRLIETQMILKRRRQ
ncbi:hypothetical protein ZBT109_0161 [Zymobacter palmae]|uniref:Uncharacterized protein n=1 Tax=Zymobacter palmae TaxID=33074 RepID=A0A348HBF7_9GAMM|nr:hypothetical protein ZBT109_0161 [Zymobacter palmae]